MELSCEASDVTNTFHFSIALLAVDVNDSSEVTDLVEDRGLYCLPRLSFLQNEQR